MRNLQICTYGGITRSCQPLKHYRILLWKDYLLRRRSFWLIVAELFFSIVFIATVTSIRNRHSVNPKSSCFIQSQSLTSMGILTYMQSLICNFNYTCQQKNPQSFVTLNGFAPLIYFLDNVTHLVDNPIFFKWLSHPDSFAAEHIFDWMSIGVKLTRLKASGDHLKEWLNGYAMRFVNNSGLHSLKYVSEFICGAPAEENDLGHFFQKALNQLTADDTDGGDSNNNNNYKNKRISNRVPILNNLPQQLEEHAGMDVESAVKLLTDKPKQTVQLCPLIKQILSSSPFLVTFGRLRYFLFGQLAYYPSNQFTDEVIHNMGEYTRMLNSTRQWTTTYFTDIRPMFTNLFSNESNIMRTVRDHLTECYANKQKLYSEQIQNTCYAILHMLNPNETSTYEGLNKNWKMLLGLLDYFIASARDLLTDCFQIEKKFLPFENREDFDKYMFKHQTDLLTSPIGLVFDQIPLYYNTNNDHHSPHQYYPSLEAISSLPSVFSVSIRKDPSYLYPTSNYKVMDGYDIPIPRRNPQKEMKYFTSGFIDVQEQLTKALIQITSKHIGATSLFNDLIHNVGIEMKMFPSPPYAFDSLLANIMLLLPQLMVLTWVLSVILSVKYMVDEKESRLVDFLQTFGISLSINWLAWITISFIIMAFFSLPIVLILKYGKIIPLTDMTLSYFMILSYTASCLVYCILFTVVSVRATIASVVAGITYFLLFMPAAAILRYDELPSDIWLIGFCLIPQVSHSLSWVFLNRLEIQGYGAQWSNMWHTGNSHSIFSLGTTIILLWIGTILMGILAFWGVPAMKRYYTVFMHKYVLNGFLNLSSSSKSVKKRRKRKLSSLGFFEETTSSSLSTDNSQLLMNNTHNNSNNNNPFRNERESLLNPPTTIHAGMGNSHSGMMIPPPTVVVDGLCKVYQPSNRVALHNVNMNFYEDQITVILGRNGAGKTTLLSILVGILQPTEGKITMHGHEIQKNLGIIRKLLGYCPQYNILYDSLTVAEHIYLFGTLKGVSSSSLTEKLNDYLSKLGLSDKRNELASRLSGGQRRKLSLFLAFLGQSSVILLDEPTASLDPFSRRAVWDLLKALRKGRTIILSSHHMYESELLGDQISIISKGTVLCSGSSLSLKSVYGSGYHLLLEVDPLTLNTSTGNNNNNHTNHNDESLSTTGLMKVIQTYVNGARLLRHNANKLTIYLPTSDALTGNFTKLFQQLDNHEFCQMYHIQHFEISDSSLEEVFLTVTGDNQPPESPTDTINYSIDHENGFSNVEFQASMKQSDRINGHHHQKHQQHHRKNSFSHRNNPSSRHNLFCKNMLKAMFFKRYIYLKRHKLSWIIEFVFPCILIITAIGFLRLFKPPDIQPPMDINHWLLKSHHINELLHFYAHDTDATLSSGKNPLQSYVEVLNNPLSLTGTGCIPSSLHKFQPALSSKCLIQSNGQMKIDEAYYSKVCQMYSSSSASKESCHPLATGDVLLNLTGVDIPSYILNHSKTMNKVLFGGIEFLNVEKFELNDMLYNIFSKLGNYSQVFSQSTSWQEFLASLRLFLPPSKMIRIWYDNRGYVSAAAYLNLLQNLQYRMILMSTGSESMRNGGAGAGTGVGIGLGHPTNSGIIITNHPLPNPEISEFTQLSENMKADYLLSLFLVLSLSFIPASFVSLLVYERFNNSKHLQNLSGLLPSVYWSANFIYDLTSYLISSSVCILILVIHGESAYVQPESIYQFILTIYLYGCAMISLTYASSFIFKYPSTAFVLVCGLNLVIGTVTTFICFFVEILSLGGDSDYAKTTLFVSNWFRIAPHYCLSSSVYTIAVRNFFTKSGIPYKQNASLWSLLSVDMLCLLLQSFLLFIFVLLLEKRFYITQLMHWKRRRFSRGSVYIDLESSIQKTMQNSSSDCPYAINAESIVKHYWSQKKPTVERLSLTVRPGECYGLLGVNGAGKSTTYSMLTGHCTLTRGHVYLNGYDIELEYNKACQSIGYCPQQDALCEFMTVREMLTFYSYLRCDNSPGENVNHKQIVNKMIRLTGLQDFTDRLITTLSGGNKRKLSTGIAFIGNPNIILLDEPSTGMDPQAKYLLWKNVQHALQLNCAVLLSSHCMEECELLCNRIGLLVNGQIRCTGTPLELKTRYGLGYQVDIEFTQNVLTQFNNINELHALLNHYLPGFQLRYPLLARQQYNVCKNQPLWKLFNALAELNQKNLINYISIRQSTLEDVFVNFIHMYEKNELLDD